jgi:hypothetical protein
MRFSVQLGYQSVYVLPWKNGSELGTAYARAPAILCTSRDDVSSFHCKPSVYQEKIFGFKECNTTDAVRTIAASSQRQSGDKKCVEGF